MRIPKSVHSTVYEALASSINDTLSTGDEIGWSTLLSLVSFMYGESSTSLASNVRSDLLKFISLFPTWTVSLPTISHVSNMSPTQTLRSLVLRNLSHGDVSAAIHVVATDDTVLNVTLEVLCSLCF